MKKHLFLALFALALATGPAIAQVTTVTRQNNVAVKAEPNPASETLIVLRMGSKVTVKGRNGNWFKVTFMSSGFEFTGWIDKNAFLAQGAAPAPRPTPPPSSMDQFFDPPPSRSAPPPRSAPARSSFQDSSAFASSGHSPIAGKLILSAGFDYAIYQHTISTAGTAPGELFKFNISGPAARIAGHYGFWQSSDRKLTAGAALSYARLFLSTTTDLKDTGNTTFDSRKAKNAVNDIALKADATYRVLPALRAGASLGLRFFNFSGNDIEDSNGDPINLYVSYNHISFPAGVRLDYALNDKVDLGMNVDFLLLGKFKEKPADSTGTDPKAKTGIAGGATAWYTFLPQHQAGFSYNLLFQSVSYTGAGTRITLAATDATTDTVLHQIGLSYRYLF